MQLEIIKQRAQAFDYLFDAVVVTDIVGTIIDWNKGSERLYGYSKAEVLGKPVCILHVPEDTAHITEQVIAAVMAEGKWSGEVRMLHKDGHVGWIESMCVPIFDENQQMIGALGINRDISHRVEEAQRLQHLAYHDHLTQVPNRCLLLEKLTQALANAERHSLSFCLLFIDINEFKAINDNYGHTIGDAVLVEFAKRLKQVIRASDTLARFGGDEFVVLLEHTSEITDIQSIAEHMFSLVSQPLCLGNISFRLSCSIGTAIYPQDGTSLDTLLAFADKAMYKNKSAQLATKKA
jgi:diguanylate cyclase (GGDEF)-like protein/PAS domain S-box-containing protein